MDLKSVKKQLTNILKKEQDFISKYCKELYEDAEKELKDKEYIE